MTTNQITIQSRTEALEDFMVDARTPILAVCQQIETLESPGRLKKELAEFARLPALTCFQVGFIDRLQAKNFGDISAREWRAMGMLRTQLKNKHRGKLMTRQKNIPRRAQPRRGKPNNQINQIPGA